MISFSIYTHTRTHTPIHTCHLLVHIDDIVGMPHVSERLNHSHSLFFSQKRKMTMTMKKKKKRRKKMKKKRRTTKRRRRRRRSMWSQ